MKALNEKQEQERREFEAKQAREREEFEAEQELRAAIEAAGAPSPWLVHWRKLYGVDAAITYGERDGDQMRGPLSIEEAEAICEQLKPAAKVYARGRYRYFVPEHKEAEFLSAREQGGEEITELFGIMPWHININQWGTSCRYFTILAGRTVEVELKIAKGPRFGALVLAGNYHYYGGSPSNPVSHIDGRRIEHGRRNLDHSTLNVTNREGCYLGEFARPIMYAQGSRDNLGEARLYAYLGPDPDGLTVGDFLRALHDKEATQ